MLKVLRNACLCHSVESWQCTSNLACFVNSFQAGVISARQLSCPQTGLLPTFLSVDTLPENNECSACCYVMPVEKSLLCLLSADGFNSPQHSALTTLRLNWARSLCALGGRKSGTTGSGCLQVCQVWTSRCCVPVPLWHMTSTLPTVLSTQAYLFSFKFIMFPILRQH